MGKDNSRAVPRISCSSRLITPPWLNTATVSSGSVAATRSPTAASTRARKASSSTALGRWPCASRAHSCGFSSRICSIGMYTGRSRSYSANRSSTSMDSSRAAATVAAVWMARRCGLLTTREIGNLASASGRRATCATPSSDRSGSEPWPCSLRSGNACRTRSTCILVSCRRMVGSMTQPEMDWDAAYRQEAPPPWSIGRPQPALAVLIDRGRVRSDVLDAGCGHAALSLALAARGYTVVGLDASAAAVESAAAADAGAGLTTATFAQADVTNFRGYDGRFSTILDSGLFHALLPERRQDYLRSIFRAAAPGAALYILAFVAGALGERDDSDRPGPRGFTETELHDAVSTLWRVDDVRPAKVYGNADALASSGGALPNVEHDNEGHFMAPGFLLSAHKPEL